MHFDQVVSQPWLYQMPTMLPSTTIEIIQIKTLPRENHVLSEKTQAIIYIYTHVKHKSQVKLKSKR